MITLICPGGPGVRSAGGASNDARAGAAPGADSTQTTSYRKGNSAARTDEDGIAISRRRRALAGAEIRRGLTRFQRVPMIPYAR